MFFALKQQVPGGSTAHLGYVKADNETKAAEKLGLNIVDGSHSYDKSGNVLTVLLQGPKSPSVELIRFGIDIGSSIGSGKIYVLEKRAGSRWITSLWVQAENLKEAAANLRRGILFQIFDKISRTESGLLSDEQGRAMYHLKELRSLME